MLQISTGKFFDYEAHETLRRTVYHTNYRVPGDERVDTVAGSLLPAAGIDAMGALASEIVERIQKLPGGPHPGEMIATSGETLVNDFAAVVSFALGIPARPISTWLAA